MKTENLWDGRRNQMLFDYARVTAGQSVLIHGAAGNVGAYAVQMAKQAGIHVVASAGAADLDYVRDLGAERVMDCDGAIRGIGDWSRCCP